MEAFISVEQTICSYCSYLVVEDIIAISISLRAKMYERDG